MGQLSSGDWPGFAVALLVEAVDDPEVAELAAFGRRVSPWKVNLLTESLYDRYGVAAPADSNEAVASLAGLMAADFQARPATVTGPMIRVLARLAPPDLDSDLANQCYGVEEYLDCDCSGDVDPAWENELLALSKAQIPDGVIRELARPLRSTLPLPDVRTAQTAESTPAEERSGHLVASGIAGPLAQAAEH